MRHYSEISWTGRRRRPSALVHHGKVKTLPTPNTRLKKITQSYSLPRISLGDLRYMYLADLIKKEKQFKKIIELFGYANPYRMLNLCQQIADIQGEILTSKRFRS